MRMDRLLTRSIERVKRKRHIGPVYRNRQVGMRMVELSEDTMAQIVGQRYGAWWRAQEDDGGCDYRNQDHCNTNGGNRSLTSFPLDVS